MIDVKEFVEKGYQFYELPDNMIVLNKVVKDKLGVKIQDSYPIGYRWI